MTTISDIGGGNNDYPDLISWGNARGSSTDLEIAHVYSDQFFISDFDHRNDFTGGYEVVGMGNDFVGDFTDTGVIRITRDPSYTSWLIDDRTGRGHWKNLIIDCVDNEIVFRGGIKTFRATNVGFKSNNTIAFDETSVNFNGIFNQCAFFSESREAASFRYGQVEVNDCIAVSNFNTLYGNIRIRDMSGVVTNTVSHEDSGSLCVGADGSTVTGSGCVTTDSSAVSLSIGSQDPALASYFEDISTGDLRINSTGQAALPASLSWAYTTGGGVGNAQSLTLVSSEQITQATTFSLEAFNRISPVVSEQRTEANILDVFVSELANSLTAEEKQNSTLLTIKQSAAQGINSLIGEHKEEAEAQTIQQLQFIGVITAEERQSALNLTINQSSAQLITILSAEQIANGSATSIQESLKLATVTTYEIHNSYVVTVEQSAGQSVNLVNAEQLSEAASLPLIMQEGLDFIIIEQLSDSASLAVESANILTMLQASELQHAHVTDVLQYTGQFVTLIEAEHTDNAETLLVSQVNTIDILQSQQTTDAEFVMFNQGHRVKEITAEQLTEAEILSILMSGDNRNLSGLRLVPITDKYKVIPKNNTRYTFTEV